MPLLDAVLQEGEKRSKLEEWKKAAFKINFYRETQTTELDYQASSVLFPMYRPQQEGIMLLCQKINFNSNWKKQTIWRIVFL